MKLTITIDKNSETPPERQIIEQITAGIQNGLLNPGDSINSENQLAEKLEIPVTSAKKALEELERNHIIEIIHDRGILVSSSQDVLPEDRKEKALQIIDNTIVKLLSMKFTHREIQTFFDLRLLERREMQENLHIAAVDCNPEALSIYSRQLGFITRIQISPFLLKDIAGDPSPISRLKNFPLIITTARHHSELLGLIPDLKDRIVKVGVSTGQGTIMSLASLKSRKRIGIICESNEFFEIVKERITDMELNAEKIAFHSATRRDIASFLESNDVIILPPGYSLPGNRSTQSVIQDYTARGGVIVDFDYQIDRESLLIIEERIKELMDLGGM